MISADRYQRTKEKLRNREKLVIANLMNVTSPLMLAAFEKADCILLDKEHGVYGTEELIPLTMQARNMGIPTIVRVEDTVYHLIAKALDVGADGIMLPRVESAAQVGAAVEAMKFAPIGRTGFGGWGILRDGEDFEGFQRGRILLVQIESPAGLAAMEEMIALHGRHIDGFVIGPNDYSIMMGLPRQLDHPRMIEEYRKFYEICKKHGKSCGVFDPDLAHAARDRKMGANIFWISDDVSCMKAGFEQLADGVGAL